MLWLLNALILIQGLSRIKSNVEVKANVLINEVVTTTDEKFLSITLGSRWCRMKQEITPKVVSLVSALSPAYLRIGGTTQDYIHWDKTCQNQQPKACFNATQADKLYTFAKTTKLDLIFGLPALKSRRTQDGSWNSTNAIEFFQYLVQKGETRFGWELGNEPDKWHNHNIQPEQLAIDVQQLKLNLKKYGFNDSKIYGPDVSSLRRGGDFFTRYLKAISNDALDAVTWHQYYGSSRNKKVEYFIDVKMLDRHIAYFNKAATLVQNRFQHKIPIWLGETSSTYDSGAPGISDSYVAGFMWLDKLGSAALLEHKVVCRQSIYGGHYSLLDLRTLDPLPDYWASVLYKRLMGTKVLKVENALKAGLTTRVYVHCTRITEYYDYKAGAVTLIVMNLNQNDTIDVELQENLQTLSVDQYLLQPGTGKNLTSKTVTLNGKLLNLLEDSRLPELNGIQVKQPFFLPPITYGFYVVPEANAKACLDNDASI